jgi:uncharacterized protein DUF4199
MNIKIELRYAILTALVFLLWLIIEYVVGLQDTYIVFYPLASIVMAVVIPIVTYRLALIEKLEQKYGKLTFGQAFASGFLITIFSGILAVPVLLGFHQLINPDFLETMILYSSTHSKQSIEQVAMFFNLKNYIAESVFLTMVVGTLVSLVLAFRMRTIN